MKNTDGAVLPIDLLKLKYLLPFFVSYVQLVTPQYEYKELHVCNQGSNYLYEKYIQFLLRKGSHHMQPPNQLSLSAKMDGTQWRILVNPWRMLKGTSWAKVTLNSEKSSP